MTRRLSSPVLLLVLAGGCNAGPRYQPAPVVPRSTAVGAPSADSSRGFFDSLALARQADSGVAPLPPARVLTADSLADLAWVDLLRDSTMLQLIETALRQNRDVQAALGRIREYRAQLGVARGPGFPSLTVNGSASTNQVAIGSFPPTSYDALRLTGDVAWELDLWGRIRRGVQAARADLASQEASQRAVVLSLVSDVASGYLQLLELDQEQAISRRTLASRQTTLGLAQQRFERGLISELDVRQFEAQVAVPAARLAQVERLRAETEHRLNALLGEAPTAITRGGTIKDAVAGLVVPDSLPAELLGRRPDVVQAERAYAAATARIGAATAARLPTISITGYYGTQSPNTDRLFTSRSEVYQLLGGVSIPLFTGGRLENQVGVARARAEQARAQYEQTVLTALREASDAMAGLQSSRDQVNAQRTQVGALRRATELAVLRYRTGVASYLEVLDSERALFDAELALSQAELGQLTAAVALYKALGGSWQTEETQSAR
jgi:multidrug efflux system outer membrane protein